MIRREEWDALGEQGQYQTIIRAVCFVARDRNMRLDPLEHVGGVWERVAGKLDDADDKDLFLLVLRSAERELEQVRRHEHRDAVAADFEVVNTDNESMGSVTELIEGADSVENEAVLRVDFSAFYATLDAVNRRIVDGLATGFSAREVAGMVGLSHTSINKRVRRMREALAPCVG